jgi:S-adenosylmethionine:tRNA ribosyltransferase-isomerase
MILGGTVLTLKLEDFEYELPDELIAQEPAQDRDRSGLMVLDRATGTLTAQGVFADLPDHLPPEALLVVNDALVVPARLYGRRQTGGLVEVVILEPPAGDAPAGDYWLECLLRPARKINHGEVITFEGGLTAELVRPGRPGLRILKFRFADRPARQLEAVGRMPLPPYIRREPGAPGHDPHDALDKRRYQTVYAARPGAVAAPTAGLHFTPELLGSLQGRGQQIETITLYVGYGTFAPVKETDLAAGRLHPERLSVSEKTAEAVNQAKAEGRPVVAVGTTVVRALEHAAADGRVAPTNGGTRLFIQPGYEFKAVDQMITNFHLPGSTLLMLVAAFAGRDFILDAYRRAVAGGYRFYSYGDAMYIR